MAASLESDTHQRSLRDFLQLYNTITEFCFNRCVSNFNERWTSNKETSCIDVCTQNYVHYNQRFMFNFVSHQERRKQDQEAQAVEAARQAEAQRLQEAAGIDPTSGATAMATDSTGSLATGSVTDSSTSVPVGGGSTAQQHTETAGAASKQMEQAAQMLEQMSVESSQGAGASGLTSSQAQLGSAISPVNPGGSPSAMSAQEVTSS